MMLIYDFYPYNNGEVFIAQRWRSVKKRITSSIHAYSQAKKAHAFLHLLKKSYDPFIRVAKVVIFS